ncbi:2824_t:CDS:1, partial [Racocetra persica]
INYANHCESISHQPLSTSQNKSTSYHESRSHHESRSYCESRSHPTSYHSKHDRSLSPL